MTDNLELTQVAESQDTKEVFINTQAADLDAAATVSTSVLVDDSNAATVAIATLQRANNLALDDDSPVPDAAITITLTAFVRGMFTVTNNTSFDATVQSSAQVATAPVVPAGETFTLTMDGTDVVSAGGGGGVDTFLALTDTPSVFSGQANKVAAVNSGETALEFVLQSGAAGANVISIAHKGALIKKSGSQSIASGGFRILTWATADYDTTQARQADNGLAQRFWLGVDFDFVDGDVTTGTDVINETGHGFLTGEGPFRLTTTGTLPAGLAVATNYWAIRVDDDNFKCAATRADAIAGTAVDITAAAGGGTHTVDRETRLVVPTGVTKVRLAAGVDTDATSTSNFQLYIGKNGAAFPGDAMVSHRMDFATISKGEAFQTPVLEVTEGDYFDVQMETATSNNLDATAGTFFALEVVEEDALSFPGVTVERPHIGARATKSGDQTGLAASIFNAFTWDQEDYDTGYQGNPFHDNATNNSRMTVPANVTRVRLHALIGVSGATATIDVRLRKNGANMTPDHNERAPSGQQRFHMDSGVVDVVEGDYFEVVEFHNSGTVTVRANDSLFEMEIVETDEAATPPEQIDFFANGTPTANDMFYIKVAARRFVMEDDLAGSTAHAQTAPSGGSVNYDVKQNGSSIGTISFADGVQTATFVTSGGGQEQFELGDRLEIVAPADLRSMADVAFALLASRN